MHYIITQEQQDHALATQLQRRENEIAIADIENEDASQRLRTGWSGHAALTSSRRRSQSSHHHPTTTTTTSSSSSSPLLLHRRSDVFYRAKAGVACATLVEVEKDLERARFRREIRGVNGHI
eukprot:CAMPEP_0172487130 /NCGR_PEP_ID=MMETSP1066-20121228/16042_1 /TAXON_ID=671091 /ORGANISM="Coscinodiscus wailesii, Strain CCMP2513" /LENGTH=121 /DNA_ID=CAMNT_0013253533 /DNA_START=197 /DNA_END=562 /DNA_ORIENTATION=-